MSAIGLPPGHFGLDPLAPMSVSYLDSVGAKVAFRTGHTEPPLVEPIRPGMPLVAPRVLYIGAAIPTGMEPTVPLVYTAEGFQVAVTETAANPAFAEQARLDVLIDEAVAIVREEAPDLIVGRYEHPSPSSPFGRAGYHQEEVAGGTIAGEQYDHMACPPTTLFGGRYIGCKFLNVFIGGGSIGTPRTSRYGYSKWHRDKVAPAVARVASRKGYLAGYAVRCWAPDPTLHDGLGFATEGLDEDWDNFPPSARSYYESLLAGARTGFREHPGFMASTVAEMREAGIDATYEGDSSAITGETLAALILEAFGIPG